MTQAQVGSLDVEKRELDAQRAAKQQIIAYRRQAEKDEEDRIAREAIEALGIDALGPMPMAEPGSYHALVDATEHRVPILAAQPGTEQDGAESGKASSYHVFAPPMRENLHMDEARKRRAHVHCDRYDFSFSDKASRRTAWHGTNTTKEEFLRMGMNPLTGAYKVFPSTEEKTKAGNKYAAEIMTERMLTEVSIRKQMLEQSARLAQSTDQIAPEGWNDTGANVTTESLQLQSEIMASMDRSKVRRPALQKAPILWKGKGKDAAASLVETNRMFELSDHTHLPDGTLSALCLQERMNRAGVMRPRSTAATVTETGHIRGGQNLSRSASAIDSFSSASAADPAAVPSQSLIPFKARQVTQVGYALQAFKGQPLASRGVMRQLRGEPARPLPNPRGPPRKIHPKGKFRRLHGAGGYGNFDDRGLFPQQTAKASDLPPKPHWATPVMIEDFMPSKEEQKKRLEAAANRAVTA